MASGEVADAAATVVDDDRFVEQLVGAQGALHSWIAMQLPYRQDAEEVYQQTCLILWKKRSSFDPALGTFFAWACGVARYEVRGFIRRNRRERVFLSGEVLESLADLAEPDAASFDSFDSFEALESCLQRLPADQLALVQAFYRDQNSLVQIAKQRSLAPATLYMRLHRIRRRLLACLERSLAAGEGL